jgi:hypothetical protein
MKFYETYYEEYIQSVEKYNIHPELTNLYSHFPSKIKNFDNLIVYGPPGVGKYSQVLYFLKKYSPSELKYEKKITCQTDKLNYIYHISDIHYEIDISLLGCNSKLLMYEVFFQIVDIVSVKQDKFGIIICKNFHMIHNELLDIFYSYIQQFNHPNSHIQIKFVILTEHISFIPNNIINACKIISIQRPTKEHYLNIACTDTEPFKDEKSYIKRITNNKNKGPKTKKMTELLNDIDNSFLINGKEMSSFHLISDTSEIPKDNFNTICNNIIRDIENIQTINFIQFRDNLYDILIYNLDTVECIWNVLSYFIQYEKLSKKNIELILDKMHLNLKYYNNNYRPIYHLENIFYYILTKIHDDI